MGKYTLNVNDNSGKAILRIEEGKRIFRTNKKESIMKHLEMLSEETFLISVVKGEDLYLKSVNNTFILKNCKQNIYNEYYTSFVNSIDYKIPEINLNNFKIIIKNKERLATLALTGVVLLSSVGIIKNVSSKDDVLENNPNEIVSVEEDIVVDEIIAQNNIVDVFESTFPVGNQIDEFTSNLTVGFKEAGHYEPFEDYSSDYGVDPNLLLALATTETGLDHSNTIPGGYRFNGCGYGIMQVEDVNIGSTVSAYNYNTKQTDSIEITEEKLIDYETNVQIGTVMFKNCLDKYNGNIYLTIQSYNYGISMMDRIIDIYAAELGVTPEDVMKNYNDLGWMKYVEDVHINPKKYISDWEYNTYGSDMYIKNVLGFYSGNNIVFGDLNAKTV